VDELRRDLDFTEAANGFANRFLWVAVRRSKYLPEGGHLDEKDLESIREKLKNALDFAGKAERLQFDEEALTMWYEIYRELSEGHPGMFGAVTSRAEAQCVRLALIYDANLKA
jgi:hypothetical protein